jgi:hypothetical protein
MVRQVPVVGILMIVNGLLIAVMGLLYGLGMPLLFAALALKEPPPDDAKAFLTVFVSVFGIFGFALLAIAFLHVVAGFRCRRFRNRMLGFIVLFSNVLPLFTTYCAPTSIGLMVYGLIVFFQPDVTRAFAMGDQGVPVEEILQSFDRPRYDPRDDYDDRDRDWDRPEERSPGDDHFRPG